MHIIKFSNERDFLDHCLDRIKEISANKIQTKSSFHIVLTGGDTAKLLYSELKYMETDWSKWFFYFGDERCVPKEHTDSNWLMAERVLFKFIPVNERQIFRIPGHLGPQRGALEYSESIKSISSFDLVLLGLGEDGHVASLFPGMDLTNEEDAIAIYDSPKLPKERVSLSLNKINLSEFVFIIAKGKKKAEVIKRIEIGEILPVTLLAPLKGLELCYFSD
ncbi:6-phosphogluconolactonase [Leptospira interrogans]|uniref:6-phosphogluconolactonase n=1 Tax=Leptospira interrogans serovar Canicola TaxID=211880 RepID=D4HSJ2_LEPIR|nr:6-phosphogluconolactonase [Leptospira interrogans]ADC93875.1 6-phosphogluconolactonase [Leptospira interrogans serovar Canicola]ASV06240.1 6-phosphogluconolactonase [Leptospira interrogans serovar Canicola]ASV09359.1 6-phosphogluconolactonase [Leptospira interrogans serovar Canicola]EKO67912.1 6-phosphogluconolactonase [Leptospira interrogans serovar Canicola str. Fiocruz LV133]EMK17966.1 6-phosphogluconolactonase [Leptospira interrogans str. Kito]